MSEPFTHGVWTVKTGREDEFVRLWTEFANWSKREVAGARWAKLLRDRERPNRFISIGPWTNLGAIERWRDEPGWRERVQALRPLLEGFEASTCDTVVDIT